MSLLIAADERILLFYKDNESESKRETNSLGKETRASERREEGRRRLTDKQYPDENRTVLSSLFY